MVNPKQTKFAGGKSAAKPEKENGKTNEPAEWEIGGWLNRNKNGNSIIVSGLDENGESVLMGFINVKQIEKLLAGEIKGTPFKMPPADTD